MDQRLLAGGGILALLMILGAGATATGWIDNSGDDSEDGYQVPEEFNDFDPESPQEVSSDSFRYNIQKDDILTESNVSLEFTGLNGNQEYIFGFVSEGEFLPVKNLSSSPGGASEIDYDFRPVERDITFDYEKGGYQQYLYYPDGTPAHKVDFYSGLTFYDFDSFDYTGDMKYGLKAYEGENEKTWSEDYSKDFYRIKDRECCAGGSVEGGFSSEEPIEVGESVLLDVEISSVEGGANVRTSSEPIQNGNGGETIGSYNGIIEIEKKEDSVVYSTSGNEWTITDTNNQSYWSLAGSASTGSFGTNDPTVDIKINEYSIMPSEQADRTEKPTVYNSTEYNFKDYRLSSEGNVGIEFRDNSESEFEPFFPEGNSEFMKIRNTDKGNVTFTEFRIEEPENGMVQSIMSLF